MIRFARANGSGDLGMAKSSYRNFLFGKSLSAKQFAVKFRPYAIGIGNVVLAWNRLQDTLAILFWWFSGRRSDMVMLKIWHSSNNDRAQRALLRALIESIPESEFAGRVNARADIIWLLGRADHFSDGRNDAIHSPYSFNYEKLQIGIESRTLNPKAQKLAGKNLLAEFETYAKRADEMYKFVMQVYQAIIFSEHPTWPERPQSLLSDRELNPKAKPHQKTAKAPPPQR
jgi:hypothetical protein